MEFREITGTLHRKGTAEYDRHVAAEQQAMRDHLERQIGRKLTDDERRQVDATVKAELDRISARRTPRGAGR